MNAAEPFVRVVPKEIGQYGPGAAAVLAHIRYRCETDGPGRFVVDGVRWWQVSYADLGKELCMSRDAVKRALARLGDAVTANHFEPFDNQTRAYHVPAYDNTLTCQGADSPHPDLPGGGFATPPGRNRHGTVAESPPVLLSGDIEEGGEGGRGDAAPHTAKTGTPAANGKPATQQPQPMGDDPPEDQSSIEDEPAAPAAANAAPPDLMALPLPPIHWPEEYQEPEPPVRCPKHAGQEGWVPEPCPPCGAAEKVHKAWEAKREQWRKQRSAAVQAWIAACDQCDEAGWLMDDPDDSLPAVKCPHAPNVMAWPQLHPNWRQEDPAAATHHRRAS